MEYEYRPGNAAETEENGAVRERKDHRGEKKYRGSMDMPFFLLTLVILTLGVIMVLSASYVRAYYTSGEAADIFTRQLIFAVLGVAAMLAASVLPVKLYKLASMPLLALSLLLLVATRLFGVEENGARRWLDLGFTTFQPSEIAKLAIILEFARLSCIYNKKMRTFRYGVMPFAAIVVITVGLLILEPHYSASIIIIAIALIMMFMGGTRLWYFIVGIIAVAVGGILAYKFVPYVAERVNTWRDPFSDMTDSGFQTVQSLYAVGSGGFLGLGLGQSRQKFLYLPEEHNDFIFSVVCEELGFLGAVLILILFSMLIIRGFWIAMHAKDRYGALIAAGISALLAIQVFLNVAVVTNLIPCTGISLPFFSYGGTALLIQMGEMGIVLAVSREIEPEMDEPERLRPEYGSKESI